jgi:hypothetical protein
VCVVFLVSYPGMQSASFLRSISMFSCVTWLYHSFSHYLINGTIFEKQVVNTKCVFLYNLSEIKINLKSIQRHTIINTERSSHVKYPLIFSNFNEIWIFSTDFQKIQKYRTSWKSVQWGQSCSMRTGRQTDRQTWRR